MKYLKTLGINTFVRATLLVILLVISACMPEQAMRREFAPTTSNSTTDTSTDTTSGTETTQGQLPESVNFLQIGTSKYSTVLSMFADYNDSMIIRGNQINLYLKEEILNNPGNMCLVAHFPDTTGTGAKKVLVLAARIRNYFNSSIGGREYFLQVEMQNETANVSDCLTINLNNSLNSDLGTTSFAYKLSDLCPNCSLSQLSNGLKLYNASGSENANVILNHLRLSITPALGSTSSNSNTPTCTNNDTCSATGYDCCVQGQCVIHGTVKNGIDQNSTDYTSAVQQILARPELIANYQEYFYVCPTMVPTNPENDQLTDPDVDPIQQAADLFIELQDLYNCLNPVIDEFSICTKEYDEVSKTLGQNGGTYPFAAGLDDLTFSNLNASLTYNNITGIEYAGIKLYEAKLYSSDILTPLNSNYGNINGQNDSFTTAQTVDFSMDLPSNAINDMLKVRYRVDGTCERIGSTIAKCKKYYKQGQSSNPVRSSDHSSGQTFKFPDYANLSYNVIVEVGGARISPGDETWELSGYSVIFDAANYPIFNNQEVTITYFVTSGIDTLLGSREDAQIKVDDHCSCGEGITCNLQPVYSDVAGVSTLTSYECLYPQPDVPDPPLQKTVFISARSVAHKYYDANGVSYDYDEIPSESQQECALGSAGNETGCNLFKYTNGDVSRPNNVDQYTGITEIFGSFNTSEKSPIPATDVDVVKGRYYDLFTDEGVFSSCLGCGTDYYTNIQKLFPDNFLYKGGGYMPDMVESRKVFNKSKFNADDMKYGRACFVPPTMIPWTHAYADSVTEQRRKRLMAQHFLFANGYNKDWFGFDYGSLIGSFDGVKWFAIGNQRRIQAKSNKLFLAINAYYGDVTAANTFRITISETAAVVNSGSTITHDTESDGAQCQSAHFCSKDEDCITQLGYDYSCQNVSSITTPWPQFDSNGDEISGSVTLTLLGLVGGSNGQVKRCVYRGRGAICNADPQNIVSSDSYTGSDNPSLHTCSSNTYCESLDQAQFNTKIARYGNSPADQNNKTYITEKTDTFGMGTRYLGRPFKFYGDEAAPSIVSSHLTDIDVDAICIPGKDPDNASTTMNILDPNVSRDDTADKISEIGKTMDVDTLQDPKYFSACPTTGDNGNYTHNSLFNLDDEINHSGFSISQNMSTNSLALPSLDYLNIFNDESTQVDRLGLHKNTCLRAPGAKCFSDMDCSPNSYIAGKIKTVSNFNGEISEAEQNFWKEDLVCANSQSRVVGTTTVPNPFYELYEHKCCRESGKDFTYASQRHEDTTGVKVTSGGTNWNILIPGINMDLNDPRRYSRIHTTYDKMVEEPSKYPPLYSASANPTAPLIISSAARARQYNTLHLNNSRMCCTGHWVREFAEGTNGNNGGHKFSGSKQQSIDISKFRSINWRPNNDPPLMFPGDPTPFGCTAANAPTDDCEIKTFIEGSKEEERYLKFMGKLELLGIPQVLIETNRASILRSDEINPIQQVGFPNQNDITFQQLPLELTIKDDNGTNPSTDGSFNGLTYTPGESSADVLYNDGVENLRMYSAGNMDNFEVGSSGLKRVFSEDKFNCCIPTGFEVADAVSNEDCCSGQVSGEAGKYFCCLNDYTDLSVYTNRYVSSEGAFFNGAEVSDDDIDPTTGYIKKEIVMKMAATMCCSGQAAYGVAISELYIPMVNGLIIEQNRTRRWLYIQDQDNANELGGSVFFFGEGQKYNDHVYCVPGDGDDGGGSDGSGGVAQ